MFDWESFSNIKKALFQRFPKAAEAGYAFARSPAGEVMKTTGAGLTGGAAAGVVTGHPIGYAVAGAGFGLVFGLKVVLSGGPR